ncbi:MAG: NADH:ubiquinone reductase (Na(+)-transporting) subunit D [Myxococcota bacterium]
MTSIKRALVAASWVSNPIAYQVLGICSALAVTVQLEKSLVMGVALTVVLCCSNVVIAVLRNHIPHRIRIIVQLSVISGLVIVVDQFLKAYYYEMSKELSVFVGLIITNCIVMGRAEAFAMSHPPMESFWDGLGNGFGYAWVLALVGAVRELLGSGTLLGYPMIPQTLYDMGYVNNGLMMLSPAAFIFLGLIVWGCKALGGAQGEESI